jgi:protein-S-isoprenylcysteine O-methyltransferase Ste14
MLAEIIVASFLLVCLGCFFSVNLYNILKFHRHNEDSEPHAEVKPPPTFVVYLAGLGTLVYFAEALFYPLIVFANMISPQNAFLLGYDFPFMPYARITGMILTGVGHILFVWSVIARGKYATSWEMKEDHRLVTWGPYRHVRHPSYLGYFLMFIGLIALWPNVFTLVPLLAIPGYNRITIDEERLLEQRFGAEYVEYKNRTGRFIPIFR